MGWNKKLKQLPSEQSKRQRSGRQKRNNDFSRRLTMESPSIRQREQKKYREGNK